VRAIIAHCRLENKVLLLGLLLWERSSKVS
jgi:hypothetical protein